VGPLPAATGAAPPAPRRRRTALAALGAAVVAAAGSATIVWFTSGGAQAGSGAPAAAPTAATAPSAAAPPPGDARIVLAQPVDDGTAVTLTWTGPDGWDYGVDVAPDGRPTDTLYVHRTHVWKVAVQAGLRYCFQVRATDSGHIYESNIEPVRGAVCASG